MQPWTSHLTILSLSFLMCKRDDKSLYLIGQLLGYQRDEILKCKAEGLGKSQCPRQRRKEIWEATVSRERGGSAQGAGPSNAEKPQDPAGV